MAKTPTCKSCRRVFDKDGDIFVDVVTAFEDGFEAGGFYMCPECWDAAGRPKSQVGARPPFQFRKNIATIKHVPVLNRRGEDIHLRDHKTYYDNPPED